MTGSASSEDALVEQPALDWLGQAGGTHVTGTELAPDAPAGERKIWSDVVLVERLRQGVARINPELPPDAVQRVCELAMTGTSPSLIEDHRGFHELLLSEVPISYFDDAHVEQHAHASLVDFDDLANNEFVAVNQFTVIAGAK